MTDVKRNSVPKFKTETIQVPDGEEETFTITVNREEAEFLHTFSGKVSLKVGVTGYTLSPLYHALGQALGNQTTKHLVSVNDGTIILRDKPEW